MSAISRSIILCMLLQSGNTGSLRFMPSLATHNYLCKCSLTPQYVRACVWVGASVKKYKTVFAGRAQSSQITSDPPAWNLLEKSFFLKMNYIPDSKRSWNALWNKSTTECCLSFDIYLIENSTKTICFRFSGFLEVHASESDASNISVGTGATKDPPGTPGTFDRSTG